MARLGGERFRAAWHELRDVLLDDQEARIIDRIQFWRDGASVRIEVHVPSLAGMTLVDPKPWRAIFQRGMR